MFFGGFIFEKVFCVLNCLLMVLGKLGKMCFWF
jgi:hypothetical protein